MRGAPKEVKKFDDGSLPNMEANMKEIWRDAQQVDHDILTANPSANSMKVGEIKLGNVNGTAKIFIRIGSTVYEVGLTPV